MFLLLLPNKLPGLILLNKLPLESSVSPVLLCRGGRIDSSLVIGGSTPFLGGGGTPLLGGDGTPLLGGMT